ncbi:MAG: DUF4910 domain-containing protein [Desulfobacterota bacterium]|nr:DUF4910 domain-containing protein [Thermodesulfobacteriota bacterium]
MQSVERSSIMDLTETLCRFQTGVVAADNSLLFECLSRELPFRLCRYPSGATFNGWVIPQNWRVERALLIKDGRIVFDGTAHPFGVAAYSRSFHGELAFEELQRHLVTKPDLPDAYVYHCMWLYRPWAADWAFSMPYRIYKTLTPGWYRVELTTCYEPGEMLVADYEHRGTLESTIVFNCHTCHPHMANDAFAGVALLVRLFQWLGRKKTRYTYRLVLGPEHLGTVFYLRDRDTHEIDRFIGGVFVEMPGTCGPLKLASSFLGGLPIDRALQHAMRHYSTGYVLVPWRKGAGNDETVWEAPGYEVPFCELTWCMDQFAPYPEYHTSLDMPDSLDVAHVDETFLVLQKTIEIFENNAAVIRTFDGLVCLSNPVFDLYYERPDPAVRKDLPDDGEKWGHLLDCLFRYLDGSQTVLDIADKHDLPFDRVYAYIQRLAAKGLVRLEYQRINRIPVSQIAGGECAA